MDNPLITIGITCFSEGDWLLECWESVLEQTDERWTAALVMDGNTEQRTKEIFDMLSHPKLLKFAFAENVGPYRARNKAFEITETPYHFYLDADDQLAPDAVATVLEAFQRFPEAAYVYGDLELFGARNGLWRAPISFTADDLLLDVRPPGPCAYSKSLWERLGGFAEELADGMADYDFFFGAYEKGAKGVHCGKAIYKSRIGHAGRVSQSYRHRYHEKCEIIIRRHPQFFSDPDRRLRLMARGYAVSADTCFHKGLYRQSREYALQAMTYGNITVGGIIKNWRYFIPAWSIPLGDRILRKVRSLHLLR